jgi:lysophospholipase L1-like esterase
LSAITNANDDAGYRLGVLAFGDSITNGGGELQWGVALQSWALWVARGLGLPFTTYAVDGARAADVLQSQIPAFRARTAHPEARYELGCLYIGVNDVRAVDWDRADFERHYRPGLRFLRERCERVLTLTAPLDLGRPRTPGVPQLNATVIRSATEAGALVLELSDFRGRNLVMADGVHPTASGQIAIAERALNLLERNGMRVAARPSSLVSFETSWWSRLLGDATYAYRYAKVSARGLVSQAGSLSPEPISPPPRSPAAADARAPR